MARGSEFQKRAVLGDIIDDVVPVLLLASHAANVWMSLSEIEVSCTDSNSAGEKKDGMTVGGTGDV